MFSRISIKIIVPSISRFGDTGLQTAWRCIRSVAKRQPINSVKTLKGEVKTEYDSKFDDDYMSMQNLTDLKKMVNQVFLSTDEMQTEAEYNLEEDYDAPIEHAEKYYDMNRQEEKQHKRMVKKNIIAKKYFKEPRETNLLTYAAKMQIRHLHQLDPTEWTPEKLAECFPISAKGAKRLLKNNFQISEEKIKQHDADVAIKWQLLESGNTKAVSPITQQLYLEGKITRDHHTGNFSLPFPEPQKKILQDKQKKIGEHAAMIKYYLDLKKNTDTKHASLEAKGTDINLNLTDNKTLKLSEYEQRDILKSVLPEYKSAYPTRKEMETIKSASYLAAEKPIQNEIEIPQTQFEENLLREYAEKHTKSSVDVAYEEWVQKQILENSESSKNKPEPFDCKGFFEAIKKYNGNAIELNTDNSNVRSYDENLGYSRKDTAQRRIKIPEKKYVKGALYRVGQNFYADNGEFLYKVYV